MELNLKVNAVQWNKDGDHPDVTLAGPALHRRGHSAYITGMCPVNIRGFWLSYEPIIGEPTEEQKKASAGWLGPQIVAYEPKDGSPKYFRWVHQFSCWSIKGDRFEDQPIATDDRFYEDYELARAAMGEREKLKPYGRLQGTVDTSGWSNVFPGYWIVEVGGKRIVMRDEDFKKQYPT